MCYGPQRSVLARSMQTKLCRSGGAVHVWTGVVVLV